MNTYSNRKFTIRKFTIRKRKSMALSAMSFRLPEEEKMLIKKAARKKKCSVSDMLRTAWHYFADKHNLFS
jgi:uncharacterized protein (DUF1778 family)